MRVKVTYGGIEYILGIVELVEMELLREGGVEPKYGKNSDNVLHGGDSSRRHRVGMKRLRFRLRRWFKADLGQTDLLFLLHDKSLTFDLEEYVQQTTYVLAFSGIKISDCVSYGYRHVGGTANDIVVEEIVGEGTSYSGVYTQHITDISSWITFYDMYLGLWVTLERFSFGYVNLQIDSDRFPALYQNLLQVNVKIFNGGCYVEVSGT